MESGETDEAHPADSSPEDQLSKLLVFDPAPEERFVTCVPFFELAAAAGAFGPEQPIPESPDHRSWVRAKGHCLKKDMFAIRVVGRSMEPRIPENSICLFRGGDVLAGTRQGRIVLAELRDAVDPESGGRLTVKLYYASEKSFDESGDWQHSRIELKPLNSEYEPIVLESADDDAFRVRGEFVAVISSPVFSRSASNPSSNIPML